MSKTLLITGAGSLNNGWVPVKNALKEFYDPILLASEESGLPNLFFANMVHQLRWVWALIKTESDCESLSDERNKFKELKKLHEQLKQKIANYIKSAEEAGTMTLQPDFKKIQSKFLIGDVNIITTNWDRLIDKFAKENKYQCLHLHGDRDDPDVLLLPSETHEEGYCEGKYNRHICEFFRFFEKIDILVLYGISLSPLDAELGILINEGFQGETALNQIVIIDKYPEVVSKRLRFILRDLWQQADWDRKTILLLRPEEF